MKTLKSVLSAALAFSLLSCAQGEDASESRAERIVAEIHNPASEKVLVISHRGDWRNYPENSIPAIESAIKAGVDIVELDIKLTKDSVLVLCHDKTLNRTTTGKGNVSDYTFEEIRGMRLRRAHGVATDSLRMPSLKEALAVCKDRAVVNIDHGYDFYDLVLEVTEELGVTEQVLIKGKKTMDEVDAKYAEHEHNMMYMPVIDIQKPAGEELFGQYIQSDKQPLAYEICWSKPSDDVTTCMSRIVAAGSKVWVNTLWASLCGGLDDDKALEAGADEIYGKVIDMGATMIQTDRPEFLISYLRSRGLHD